MSAFGGLILTNKGRALQAKAQAGATLTFTRIGVGDGSLSGQQIADLTSLIGEKKSLAITKLKTQAGGKAVVGGILSNQDIITGFYFREIGVFAQDPDDGEILYCYGNSGAGAEYIPAGGGPDIVEKNIDIITLVGQAESVSAEIDETLVFVTQADLDAAVKDFSKQEATIERRLQTILTDQETPVWMRLILGRTLVNLLGNDGGCESLAPFTFFGSGSSELSTTQKRSGSDSIKIITTGGTQSRYAYKDYTYPLDSTKQYLAAIWIYVESWTSGAIELSINDVGTLTKRYAVEPDYVTTGSWQLVYIKIPTSNTLLGTGFRLLFGATGSGTRTAYFDEIRLYELSATDSTAIGTTYTTDAEIDGFIGYVDNMKPLSGVYLKRQGKQMLPPFTEWTTINANAEIIKPYELKLTATADDQYSEIYMPCMSNQSYTLNLTTNGRVTVRFLNESGIVATYGNVNLPFTVTSPINATSINILITNSTLGAGTYTFTEPMLSLDADAPFEPQNDDYMYIDTEIRSNVDGSVYDTVYEIDGQLRKVKRFEYKALDGSLPWEFNLDGTGIKSVKVPITNEETSTSTINPGGHYVVKYDGKILGKYNSFAVDGVADSSAVNGGFAFIIISDTDSGWGEDWNAGNWIGTAMIQRYVNGWKYTGTTDFVSPEWTSIYDAAVKTTDGDKAVARNLHAENGKIGYQIQYQRATEADEAVSAEVGLSFFDGLNAVELGEGIVVRERVTPVNNGVGKYNINHGSVPESYLKHRAEIILDIYKGEELDTSNWTIFTNSSSAYGDSNADIDETDIDPTAQYYVTYIAEKGQISANVIDAQIEYATNLKTVVGRNVQDIADAKRDISSIPYVYAKKGQENFIPPTLLSAWVNYFTNDSPAGYFKDEFGIVHLRGFIKSGTTVDGTVIFKLPEEYRPIKNSHFVVVSNDGSSTIIGRITVTSGGEVQFKLGGNTWLSLDGISFRAA